MDISAKRGIMGYGLSARSFACGSFAALAILLFAPSASAAPSIAIDGVLQRYPWSNIVDIRYTVSGVEADNLLCGVDFVATTPGGSISAGRTIVEGRDGTFTYQWTPPAGFVAKGCTMQGMIASAGSLSGDDYMIVDLKSGAISYEGRLNRQEYSDARYNNDNDYKTTKMVFRKVPAGEYYVNSNGVAIIKANITNDYYIGIFPVTVAQYELMGDKGASVEATAESMKPKVRVSWQTLRYGSTGVTDKATAIGEGLCGGVISNLNATVAADSGYGNQVFDLPTDAMWEVAARAMPADDGSHAAWNWFFTDIVPGDASTTDAVSALLRNYAWFDANANSGDMNEDDGYGTTANGQRVVGTRLANPWGLFDIYGNVWTWCLDVSGQRVNWGLAPDTIAWTESGNESKRRVRGGSYSADVTSCNSCRAVNSWTVGLTSELDEIGFRLVSIVKP